MRERGKQDPDPRVMPALTMCIIRYGKCKYEGYGANKRCKRCGTPAPREEGRLGTSPEASPR